MSTQKINWESSININNIVEIRGRNHVFFGVGAIQKIETIAEQLSNRGINRVIIITGKNSYISCGAWCVIEPALIKHNIDFIIYNKITPNPTDIQVDEATKLALEFGAKAVIGIGGGSPIDSAKSVAILIEYPEKSAEALYQYEFTPEKAVPIVAINTTHGTGTEIDRFAVVTVTKNEFKPAIAYDCIYPTWAIDDPALMTKLPVNQTRYVSIDAINHVVEAATSAVNSPFTVMLAKETIRLVHEFLPKVILNPEDLEARYYLLYASMIAGMCFDNGLLHFTHALEHPLSAIKPELAHGLGLSMILPAVVKTIYPAKSAILADIFSCMVPNLKGESSEAVTLAKGIEKWLSVVGVPQKLNDEGFSENDIDKLVDLTFKTPSLGLLLSCAPVQANAETIKAIYSESMNKLK